MNPTPPTPVETKQWLDSAIPRELRNAPQWIAWWSVIGEGKPVKLPGGGMTKPLKAQAKPHKLPIDPHTGNLASTTDPKTRAPFEIAISAVCKWSVTGLGFVFTFSDPYGGIDLDNCRNPETGEIADWAWEVIRALNSYTEISPSGTGVHIIIRGQLPEGKGKRTALSGGNIEMYSRGRYFTFTGIHVEGTPVDIGARHIELLTLYEKLFGGREHLKGAATPPPPLHIAVGDEELISMAKSARNGKKFERLWNGQWEGNYPSQSEADSALCALLAFWTGKDIACMDALFRRSGLMGKKWLRKDYRDNTLAGAIAITTETWNRRRRTEPEEQAGTGSSAEPAAVPSPPAESAPIWRMPIPFHQFDLPSFPVESLSGWLRDFVEAEALATQTPVDLAAMLGLSVVATACAKKISVELKSGYREPVNIYTVTALPSGSRKSAVFVDATAPIEEYERSEAKSSAGEIAKARTAYRIKETRLRRLQEQAANPQEKSRDKCASEAEALAADLVETAVPVAPRYIADDCTPEKLPGLLAENGGRIAVMSPEGDVFDLMAGRYSNRKAANFGVFLKGHAGDSIRVDRVGRPPEYVEAPAITIGLAVQPDVIKGLASEPGFRGRGLLARLLFSMPTSLLGRRNTNPPAVPDQVLADYRTNVLRLLSIPLNKDVNGKVGPYVLTLAPDAREALHEFEVWIEPQLAEFGALGSMSGWGGKIVGGIGRIAGLLHMAAMTGGTDLWQSPITLETILHAIQVGKYLIPHARAAFAEMGADPLVDAAKKILRWIDQSNLSSFTRRDAHQAMRSTFRCPEALDAPLKVLIDREFIREKPSQASGPGRKPSPAFEVNPLWNCHDKRTSGIISGNFEYSESAGEPEANIGDKSRS